ncbi:hypothetical protein BC938DRAFT_475072 [Jimgerdemannia flammicorona]|uniref:Uncharacterized protein n=1 Tax=Jimgerdemannia flammicorona TaxID=994334 RepID=A0A433QS28_9FUNG|nr:hypothetical protein BC938DRAFT_475072 [Jimgerdemannia flammicorona]
MSNTSGSRDVLGQRHGRICRGGARGCPDSSSGASGYFRRSGKRYNGNRVVGVSQTPPNKKQYLHPSFPQLPTPTPSHLIPNVPIRVRQLDEPELARRIDDHILREPRHVNHDEASPEEEFRNKVAVTDTKEGIGYDAAEPELGSEEIAVDIKGVTRQGA